MFQWYIVQCEEQTASWQRSSQETLQCMDHFQYAHKVHGAKACKSAWAPGSGRNLAEEKTWKELPSSSYF